MIERSLVFRLISNTSAKLREWGDARLAAKGSAYVKRIARLQRKLVGSEQDCAHLDKLLQVWQESD
jgi:chromosome condensin MukBEF complex kleisin-like MukF subunit